MNNLPHLLLHNNGVYFSLAAAQNHPSLSCRDSASLNCSSHLLFFHRLTARKLSPSILHGECKRAQPIRCDWPRAGHSLRFSHGRHGKHARKNAHTHGKPASFGHMKAKKRMETQRQEREEACLQLAPPAKPSEDCIARLFEQQPLRLHNNTTTFECAPQEPNTLTHKAPRMEVRSFNGDKLKPDFSIKLLDILSSFKRDNQVRDVESTGVIDSQPVENNLGEDAMQRHPQYNVFASSESQREPSVETERQWRIVDESSMEDTQLAAPNKDKRSSCAMLDNSREDVLDSPLVYKGPQDNQLALEELGFSSESSDDVNYNEVESREAIHKLENVSSPQHANGLLEHKRRQLSESSAPVVSGKGWSRIFPRHLSKSTGSRSSPSRSSIPGLRSKYSKPDPKAKQQFKKPLQLLANFEVETKLINTSVPEREDEEDDVTLQTFQTRHKSPETKLEAHMSFDWWDSDDEDDPKRGLLSSAKLPMESKVERRMGNSKMEIESHNLSQLKGEVEDLGSLRFFESLHKRTETKPEESISFEWSDSDEEGDLKIEENRLLEWSNSDAEGNAKATDNLKSHNLSQLKCEAEDLGILRSFENVHEQTETKPKECINFETLDSDDGRKIEKNDMFEWSDSDAKGNSRVEEKNCFKWKDEDAEADVGMKNGLLSATSKHPISFGIEGQSSCLNKRVATSNLGASSDQALTCRNREDYQDSGSNTYSDCKCSVGANQKSNHDGLHKLPASVKFVDAPLWKSPIFPDFPFEIHYSYSEIPKVPILGFRDHFSPFAPKTMERPWTGGAHRKPRRHAKAIESFDHALERQTAFELTFNRRSKVSKLVKSREEILGKPLTKDEIISLVQNCHEENRQVNLGRDGLTHNMLHLIHSHWKRRPVCKLKCKGVPTLDMDNVCFHVEGKTGGKIIYRSGGTVYVFRGRNYIYQDRPVVPFMLFRPASPVYPKLVPQAPAGLTIDEARQLRILGQKVKPLLKLRKNTVLLDLVGDVKDAFQVDNLVSLDYEGVKPCDYRQIGAKLMELVPCVLLSFKNHRLLLWKGRDSKPSSILSPETCADGARLEAKPNLEATDVEGSSVSASETKCEGPGIGFSFSVPDAESVDDCALPFSEESTRLHHSDMYSLCESNLKDSSEVLSEKMLEQHWQTKIQPHKVARNGNLAGGNTGGKMFQETLLEQQLLGDVKVLSDEPTLSDDVPLSSNELRELCGGGAVIKSTLSDVSSSGTLPVYRRANCSSNGTTIPVGRSRWDDLDGRHQSSFPPRRVDDLWEVALKDGLAVELEGLEFEADLILHKATVFSEVAPPGPSYTDKVVNRLRLFGLYKKTQKRFVVPLHDVRHKNRHMKNKVAKRASHPPKIEMPPRNILQTDDLVKKLGCT